MCVRGACVASSPRLRWARAFQATQGAALSAAVDPAGDVYVGGYIQGAGDLGTGRVPAGNTGDAVLARYTPDGTPRWMRRFPGDAATLRTIAADLRGVWIGGMFGAYVELLGQTIRGTAQPDAYIARLDANAEHAVVRTLVGRSDEQVAAFTSLGDDVVVSGYYHGDATLAGVTLSPSGAPAGVAARLRTDGRVAWTRTFGATNTTLRSVAALPDGGVAVTGIFSGTQDVGPTLRAAGGIDTFVAWVAPDGTVRDAVALGGAGEDLPQHIAADARGNVYLVLHIGREATLGATAWAGPRSLVASLDAQGALRWSRTLDTSTQLENDGIAVDAAGRVVVVGSFHGTFDLGGGVTLTSRGGGDLFALTLDSGDGHLLAHRSLGGEGDEFFGALAADPCGGVVIAASYQRTLDLGGASFTTARTDGFVSSWSQ